MPICRECGRKSIAFKRTKMNTGKYAGMIRVDHKCDRCGQQRTYLRPPKKGVE